VVAFLEQESRLMPIGAAGNPPDQAAIAAYRRAFAKRAMPVVIRRVIGNAPSTTTTDASVTAVVTDYRPQPGVMVIKPEGGITQGNRLVIVLTADLVAAGFPLPLAKNDKVVLVSQPQPLPTDEVLNVVSVDPYKRAIAGAVEIEAAGI
jgi:hypothetical protein